MRVLRGRVRAIGAALVAAVVGTLVSTVGGPVEPSDPGRAVDDDRFPLEVGRPELDHVGDQPLTVAVGAVEGDLPAGRGRSVRVDGTRGVSGLVQVLDQEGRLAGMNLVPKDDVALLGLHGGGALEVPVNYRTTAFALFASQPGLVSTEPTVTTVLAALVHDLPELEALAESLREAATEDPAYLAELPEPVLAALDDLMGAFQEHAERLAAEPGDQGGGGGGAGDPGGGATSPTTQGLRGRSAPGAVDPDGCEPPVAAGVIVVDPGSRDGVCVTEAAFNRRAWELHGESSTPRWAVARAINRGVPSEQHQWVLGAGLSLPSLKELAYDLAEGAGDALLQFGPDMCNAVLHLLINPLLLDAQCIAQLPEALAPVAERFKSYFGVASFSIRLDGSEDRTVMSVNGLGHDEHTAEHGDVGLSWTTTVLMQVAVPAIGIMADLRASDSDRLTTRLRTAIPDLVATIRPEAVRLVEDLQVGDFDQRFEALAEFTSAVLRALVKTKLLQVILRELFPVVGGASVVNVLEQLAEVVEKGVFKWIDSGLGIANLAGNVVVLLQDQLELSTSARYALGYEEVPEDRPGTLPAPSPLPGVPIVDNPALPTKACGLRVALVLDRSASIGDAGVEAMEQVRQAATGLVDALGGTPSSVRISAFSDWPSTQIGWTSLADAEGRRYARQAASGVQFEGNTNWEAALLDVFAQDAHVVVFVTDGNPTAFGNGLASTPSVDGSADFDPAALTAGVEAANHLKEDGTRVIAVGVGDVNVRGLQEVAGPDEGADYVLGDLGSLGRSLATVATELCGTSVVVHHLVGGIPTGDAAYTVEVPGEDPEPLVTAADGTARLSLREPTSGPVTVRGPVGLPLEEAGCERGGQPVDARVDEQDRSVVVDPEGVAVACTFRWRGLQGDDALLGEIARGPGELRVVTFAPLAGADAEPIGGCIGAGEDHAECAAGAFAVGFAAGFAVLRYDETCTGCAAADLIEVERTGRGVRFRLVIGAPLGVDRGSGHVDLTVQPAERRSRPALEGAVSESFALQVGMITDQVGHRCLARYSGSSLGWSLVSGTRPIRTGVGC